MNTVSNYRFVVKLDRCVRSCNTLNNVSNKVCVPNKTDDLNLTVFNMIAGINESKTWTRHISCQCKCRFHVTKCISPMNTSSSIHHRHTFKFHVKSLSRFRRFWKTDPRGYYEIDSMWKFRCGFDFHNWRNIDELFTWIFLRCFDVELM